MTRVIVVAKTHMGGDARCVGAINAQGIGLRLSEADGSPPQADTDYEVGDEWELTVVRKRNPCRPHVEDVSVQAARMVARRSDGVSDALLALIRPWHGVLTDTFDGCLKTTSGGSAYVDGSKLPDGSTGFWIADTDLIARTDDGGRVRYRSRDLSIKYVGVAPATPKISAGSVVRLSLARWWRESSAGAEAEKRCYMQISGWFDR